MNRFRAANRANWDERVAIHLKDETGFYGLDRFRAGGDSVDPVVDAVLGDIAGLDLIHLQCHFGLDTLGLARRGARVWGLDFSPAAIAAARALAEETGLEARFVEADVFAAPAAVDGRRFDLVFVSWGAICWIDDLDAWLQVVADLLRPGGRFLLAEVHPGLWPLEEHEGRLVVTDDAVTPRARPYTDDVARTYTGAPDELVNRRTYEWGHSFEGLLGGLARAGLELGSYREFDCLPWPRFPMMREGRDRLYRLPDGHPRLPLAFTLWARRPED